MADKIGDYLSDLLIHAPGLPDVAANVAVYRAMQYVAQRTRGMRTVVNIPFLSQTSKYPLALPENTRLYDFQSVLYVNDTTQAVDPDSIEELRKASPVEFTRLGLSSQTDSRPRFYSQSYDGQLEVFPHDVPQATANAQLTAECVLVPQFATSVPDPEYQFLANQPFFTRSRECIVYRALHEVLSMPEKRWTNRTAANEYAAVAEVHIANASALSDDGGVPNVKRTVRYGGY